MASNNPEGFRWDGPTVVVLGFASLTIIIAAVLVIVDPAHEGVGLVQVLGFATATIAAILAYLKSRQNSDKIDQNSDKIDDLHRKMDQNGNHDPPPPPSTRPDEEPPHHGRRRR